MPYDGHQNQPGPYDAPGNINGMDYESDPRYSSNRTAAPYASYPSQYAGFDRINMQPQPQMMPPTSSPSAQNPELLQDQRQDNNDAWYQQHHTGRINEAVNSAFGDADRSSYLSPDVVSQITANVIQQLRTTGLDNIQGQQQPHPQQQQHEHHQWAPPASGAGNGYSQSPTSSHTGPESTFNYPHYPPPPPPSAYRSSPRPPSRPSPVFQPMERQGSRTSQNGEYNPRPEARPSPLSNESTDTGMTTLEKIWGKLFENGKSTKRLGQFLRGIAIHLIEDYPPGNTLVITPEKMQKFYEDTGISTDPYPWQDVFDDRTSAISRLLREVEAEHHLVQMRLDERPDVPGLTPRGFERWATLMIQAHPDKEFERLQKAVLNMPISNPDDKKERFPKEIPRSLFPETPDLALRRDVDQFIMKHCAVDLPPITDEEIAATHHATNYVSPTVEDEEEGEEEEEEEEEKEGAAPGPIERERKPYTAQPGGGRMYDEAGSSRGHAKSFSTSTGPRESPIHSVPGSRGSELHNPDLLYVRTGSAGSHRPTPTTRTGRSRSSSRSMHPGNDYRHSEGDLLGHNGGPRYPGMSSASDYYMNPPSNTPGDMGEDGRRHRDFDEDKRLYESLREREREREKSKYHDYLHPRGTWTGGEDSYRGMFGGGPVGSGSGGYDYYGY